MTVNNDWLQRLKDKKTIVKVSYYQNNRYKTHFFKGVIRSFTDKGIQFLDNFTGKILFVEHHNILIINALRSNQRLYNSMDVAGLKSMERNKIRKKKHPSSKPSFSYSKWWKYNQVEEVNE